MELVPYRGRRLVVTTMPLVDGRFGIRFLGVWSSVNGHRGYTNVTPPEESFPSLQAAEESALDILKRVVDQGLA